MFFSSIFKVLMPTYNSTPKLVRREMKDAVKNHLLSKVGSEAKLNELMMISSSQGNTFWTYGVPRDMFYEFRNWAIRELRRRFGVRLVPVQGWEENS
jgi:hypothetical protein